MSRPEAISRLVKPGLKAALKCRSCKKGRYAPPVHMIKLTKEGENAPYPWVHPVDGDRR